MDDPLSRLLVDSRNGLCEVALIAPRTGQAACETRCAHLLLGLYQATDAAVVGGDVELSENPEFQPRAFLSGGLDLLSPLTLCS